MAAVVVLYSAVVVAIFGGRIGGDPPPLPRLRRSRLRMRCAPSLVRGGSCVGRLWGSGRKFWWRRISCQTQLFSDITWVVQFCMVAILGRRVFCLHLRRHAMPSVRTRARAHLCLAVLARCGILCVLARCAAEVAGAIASWTGSAPQHVGIDPAAPVLRASRSAFVGRQWLRAMPCSGHGGIGVALGSGAGARGGVGARGRAKDP